VSAKRGRDSGNEKDELDQALPLITKVEWHPSLSVALLIVARVSLPEIKSGRIDGADLRDAGRPRCGQPRQSVVTTWFGHMPKKKRPGPEPLEVRFGQGRPAHWSPLIAIAAKVRVWVSMSRA
jgi:hypothetical protein